ncbi:DUF6177 family protein [Brachybacterium fresconis]|uniref:Uncharacterized protein n=1 Tax=Brachybacterium fresconis TaxID=173363 RepID=A0ABS4YEV1_9MICO|nr:DUF6177 family protein [Brachybacterium fresconis]MBP2407321.1 hypothetical protein [Brachybacterium fresconis]
MPAEIHPVADSWPDGLLVYEARHETTVLSAPLRAVIDDARESGRRAVLVTPATSVISWAVAERLREADGMWAVRTLDGRLFNALSGYEAASPAELWDEPTEHAMRLDTFSGPPSGGDAYLSLDVYARERASAGTRFGGLAESLVRSLGAEALESWGQQEPTTRRWDPRGLTSSLRSQMPVTTPHYVSGPYGTVFSTTVARTSKGLLEHTRGMVPIGEFDRQLEAGGAIHLARHPRLETALVELAQSFRPTVAMVSLTQAVRTGGGTGQRAAARWPDQPVAVLIGARAVRDLDLDLDELAQRHDVTHVGSHRAPCALLRLSGPDPMWHQFVAFTHDLDEERLASALAVDFARIREAS